MRFTVDNITSVRLRKNIFGLAGFIRQLFFYQFIYWKKYLWIEKLRKFKNFQTEEKEEV